MQDTKHETFAVWNTLVYDGLNLDFHLNASLATTVPPTNPFTLSDVRG